MSNEKEPKVIHLEQFSAKITPERYKSISEEQNRAKRKQKIMKAELTHIQPTSMLFNALSIASTELSRLQRTSAAGDLTFEDFKKFSILINSLVKLSEENRLVKEQSLLDGLTDKEIAQKVKEALKVVEDE